MKFYLLNYILFCLLLLSVDAYVKQAYVISLSGD